MRATDTVRTVQGKVQRESDKAILIRITSIGDRPFKTPRNEWFPFSQVSKIHKNPNEENSDYLVASEWIIEQKGLMGKQFYVQPGDPTEQTETETQVEKEQCYDPDADILEDDIPF